MTQLLSFLSIGALATLLQYLIAALLVLLAGTNMVAASTIGFLISAMFNYWANARFTFLAQGSAVGNRRQQLRFVLMVALGCLLNAVLLRIALGWAVHPAAAQVAATLGVLASNFAVSRLWVYRRHPPR
jgi:putative flippase GtrA